MVKNIFIALGVPWLPWELEGGGTADIKIHSVCFSSIFFHICTDDSPLLVLPNRSVLSRVSDLLPAIPGDTAFKWLSSPYLRLWESTLFVLKGQAVQVCYADYRVTAKCVQVNSCNSPSC